MAGCGGKWIGDYIQADPCICRPSRPVSAFAPRGPSPARRIFTAALWARSQDQPTGRTLMDPHAKRLRHPLPAAATVLRGIGGMHFHQWHASTFSRACQSAEKGSPAHILNLSAQPPTGEAANVQVFNDDLLALGHQPGSGLPVQIGPCVFHLLMQSDDDLLLPGAVPTALPFPGQVALLPTQCLEFLLQEARLRY